MVAPLKAVLLAAVLYISASTSASAICNIYRPDNDYISDLTDGQIMGLLRCMSNVIVSLQRENRELHKRMDSVEQITTELPAAYENANGKITEEPGRAIGRASFILSARFTGGANFLPLEQRVLEELCDKTGGCQISLAFREFNLFENEPKNPKISGPCLFQYTSESGEWVRGKGCGNGGSLSGIDGDQRAALNVQGTEIAEASSACILPKVVLLARSV